MARQLGVAVVGLGIGEQHARMYAALPSCQVRLLIDLDRSRAENLAGVFHGSDASRDFDDALRRDDIDVVSIASFDDAHFDQVMRSLAAGKHVSWRSRCAVPRTSLSRIRAALDANASLHLASNLVLRGADSTAGFATRLPRERSARSMRSMAIISTAGCTRSPKAGVATPTIIR